MGVVKRQATKTERSGCGAELEVAGEERSEFTTWRKVFAYGVIHRPSRSVKCRPRRNPRRAWNEERLARSNLSEAINVKRRGRRNLQSVRSSQVLYAERSVGSAWYGVSGTEYDVGDAKCRAVSAGRAESTQGGYY